MDQKANSEFLNSGMTGLFWKYALLALAGMMFSCLAVIIDGYIMGNGVGEMALAGIAVVINLMYFGMGVSMMLGVGASTLAGIKLGEGDDEGARDVYGSIIIFTIIATVIVSAVALIFIDPLLRFLGATDAVLPYAKSYAVFFFCFFPLCILGQVAYYFCRMAERPRAAAAIFIAAGLAAIVGEYFLVFHLNWGTAASAFSFVMGIAGTVFLLPYVQKVDNPFRLTRKNLKINMGYIGESVKIGLPMFLIQICPAITTVVINRQLMVYGGTDLHLSAFGIFNAYIVYVMNGMASSFATGMQPIASVNYGANRYDRLKKLIKVGIIQSFIVLLVVQIIVYAAARPIVGFFSGPVPELIDITVDAMRVFIVLYALGNISTLVGGYYIGVGKTALAIINSTTRVLIFAVPLLFIIPRFFGLEGVWMAQPVADVFACIIAIICIVIEYKKLSRSEATLN